MLFHETYNVYTIQKHISLISDASYNTLQVHLHTGSWIRYTSNAIYRRRSDLNNESILR